MKVTYLSHSGFCVEMSGHILIFDYYKGAVPSFPKEKQIIVFASHKHPDHFSFSIFDWWKEKQDMRYVFGSDIKLSEAYLERKGVDPQIKKQIVTIGKNRTERLEDMEITTLRSTDQGVAFLVTVEGKTIYHAGDLNWWHWEGEEEQWNMQMASDYQKEIRSLEKIHINLAFVPLDPRLGTAYDWGMNYFLETTDTKLIFPMHMWGKYEWIARYKSSLQDEEQRSKIMDIKTEGQEWKI